MISKQEKLRAQKKFKKLEKYLISCFANRKVKIIRKIDKETPREGEKEGIFIKLFLAPALSAYFKDRRIKVIVEGVNSNGETQFQDEFFGSKPAPDFLFRADSQPMLVDNRRVLPFPLNTVGEVKYGKLTFSLFTKGLGQIIGYLNADKKFDYGYYVFFNTNINKTITDRDKEFLEELWERENIFVVII